MVYSLGDGTYELEFTDGISVFDMPIPTPIPGKGEALCDCAWHWVELLDDLGVDHHFIDRPGPRSVRVKPVRIIRDYSQIVDGRTNHLIPLEFVLRHYIAGTLYDRLQQDATIASAVGLEPREIQYGKKLPHALFEAGTKLEPFDVFLTTEEALRMANMRPERLQSIEAICRRIDAALHEALVPTNLLHVDGKKELGYDQDGRLMIVDVFGTPDEDRFWDRRVYDERGECVERSKEAVRQYYRKSGYKDTLYEARDAGRPEPPIPALPPEVVEEASDIYARIASEITGSSVSAQA
jgi:phosphoribosylaminoimidazole-succinocarboxamide synthase